MYSSAQGMLEGVSRVAFIIEPRHDKTNKMSVRPAKTQMREWNVGLAS